jgi:hypothetical protein
MTGEPDFGLDRPLRWRDIYREVELYRAVVRVYTKPLFQWRKALSTSTDGKTLYDLAGSGLRSLDTIHSSLKREDFKFRPAVALKYNFNGKRRTLYISPWEERIVDLLLYRTLNRKLHRWFSPNSYAYRDRTCNLYRCQARIARVLRVTPTGHRVTLSRGRIQNLRELDAASAERVAPGQTGPTQRERQVLGYHKKYKTSSPLYEKIRAKFPNW